MKYMKYIEEDDVSPMKYEVGFYIPEDDILHSHHRENLQSYELNVACYMA
jgi:hypothetical protein